MNKNAFCVILSIMLLILSSTCIAEENCPDHHILIGNPTGVTVWKSLSTSQHGMYVYYFGTCFTCNTTYDDLLYKIENVESHDMNYLSDHHLPSKLSHEIQYRCSVCKVVFISYVNCPGPNGGGCIDFVHNFKGPVVSQ